MWNLWLQVFVVKYDKQRHVASVHEGKKSFKCEMCNFSASHKGILKQHIISVHER